MKTDRQQSVKRALESHRALTEHTQTVALNELLTEWPVSASSLQPVTEWKLLGSQ